jgi:DNA-binding NtrC family response regulator
VIFISGNASLSEASQCVREGAYDFIEKPVSAEKLVSLVERCYDYYSLQKRYRDLMEKKSGQNIEQGQEEQVKLIGDSVITNGLKDQLIKISLASSPTIHLKGDLGVGKRMIARFIYQHRSKKELRDFQSFSAISLNKKMMSMEQLTDLQGFILIENVENLSASSQGDLLNLIQKKVFCEKLRLITTSVKDLNEEEDFSQELFYAF